MGTIKQNRANFITTAGKLDATGLNNDVPASNITNASMTSVTAFPPSLGTGIKQVSSDPPSPSAGQVWFNTTTKVLKQYVLADGTWASGGNLNTARGAIAAAGANHSASLVFGGSPGNSANTESYNGSSWTEVNDLNSGRDYLGGQGTQTAAIAMGGGTVNAETWNGTSWTEVNNLNLARDTLGSGSGAATVAIVVGGWKSPGVAAEVELWDGTNWTEVAEMNTARNGPFVSGTSTAALTSGGSVEPGVQTKAENWNGSSWTEVGDLNTARYNGGSAGTSALALVFAGSNQAGTVDAETELFDGTTWSEQNDLSTARYYNDGAGVAQTNAILAGGNAPSSSNATEEWTIANAVQTITTS